MPRTPRKRTRSCYFYIQPIWRIQGICDTNGLANFPAYIRIASSLLKDVVEHRSLSPEALSYYSYWRAKPRRMTEWSSDHQRMLKLSVKQVQRLRGELRAHGLITSTQAGKQTYTALHSFPVPVEQRAEVFRLFSVAIRRQWGLQQKYESSEHIDVVTPFFSSHFGSPLGTTELIFIDSIRHAATQLLRPTLGMNRLRALGLWILLCSKQAYFNWSSPGNIAKELGFSTNYVNKHLETLIALKLAYYVPESRTIAVTRFPEGLREDLHPVNCDSWHFPWKRWSSMGADL